MNSLMAERSTVPNTIVYANAVKEFMASFDQPCYGHVDEAPIELHQLRANLISEELKEYYSAYERGTEELDALCDLHYVVVGTLLAYSMAVKPYKSGQLVLPTWAKRTINARPVLNDLGSCFPCQNLLAAEGNLLIARIEDVAYMAGYDILGAFKAVHANNMAKLWPTVPDDPTLTATKKPSGWLVKRADGKVVKPPGHTKVDLTPFVS